MSNRTLATWIAFAAVAGCGKGSDSAGKRDEKTPAPAAQAAPVTSCSASTEGEAIATFARMENREAEAPTLCATMLPDLDSVMIGSKAMGPGCSFHHILHQCKVYARDEASTPVLGSHGWGAASPKERERLAWLWARQVVFSGMHDEILETETPDFTAARRAFTPPTAEPMPDGGVRLTLWVEFTGRHATTTRHALTFDAAGALTSKQLGSFQGLRTAYERIE